MDQDSPDIVFLYDFVYLDRHRMASYFAQVFDGGVLTGTKNTLQSSDTKSANFDGNAVIAKAAIGGQESVTESIERLFDSSWSIPINVIDRLDEFNFIQRGLKEKSIGSLVMVKGTVTLLDIKMLKNMWEPAMDLIVSATPTTHSNKASKQQMRNHLGVIGKILDHLPPSVQMRLQTDDGEAWASLPSEHMIVNPGDLALKHGGRIEGEWHVLAVLDAKPDSELSHTYATGSDFANGMLQMMDGIRTAVGRPCQSYGVTPIAMFRSIRRQVDA